MLTKPWAISRLSCLALLVCFSAAVSFADNVVHPSSPMLDRPTLTALGVVLPITGDDNLNAQVSVLYRVTGTTAWHTGLPLYRVHPEDAVGYPVSPQFAGTIFNLRPGTSYEIQLQITDPDGPVNQIYTLTEVTRSVPAPPKNPRNVNVSNQNSLNAALSSAKPGDIITLANGTYKGPIYFFGSGTAQNPIVIRGASQTGVMVTGDNCNPCNVWELYGNYTYLENMTITNAQRGIRFQTAGSQGNVVRGVLITNTTMAIAAKPDQLDYYVCDNIVEGRLKWPLVYGTDNGNSSDDDGIALQGSGHVICHNTISGYADAMKTEQDMVRANDFYGNDILFTYDNGVELDGSAGNVRLIRNRFSNGWDTLSVQPIYGGPAYMIQNIVVNSADEQMKFHGLNVIPPQEPDGVLAYNNTFVSTKSELNMNTSGAAHYFDIENNIFIGVPNAAWHAVSWTGFIDHGWFDYDAYYPNGPMTFNFVGIGYKNWPNFAAVQASGLEEPHGLLLPSQPFATPIAIPANYKTQMMPQDVTLAHGSPVVDRGVILPNINDGYTGAGPDLGAQELGCPKPIYGPRPAGIDETNEPFGCTAPVNPIWVSVSSSKPQIYPRQTAQFTASVEGTGDTAVTWTISPALGSISASGVYTAPASLEKTTTITATATSVADRSKSNRAFVVVTGSGTLAAIPVYGTGVLSAGGLAPDGSIDAHYKLIASADRTAPGPSTYVAKSTQFPIPPWMANGPNSKWITPDPNAGTNLLNGNYTYETTFDLTGFDPTTASLSGQWASDNLGWVYLNGVNVWSYNENYAEFTPFSITTGFVKGVNTLQFVVTNTYGFSSPTGLRVELSGTAVLQAASR